MTIPSAPSPARAAADLHAGGRVWLRDAKAGELAERFAEDHGGASVLRIRAVR